MAITKALKTSKSVQEMNNLSFDEDRNVLARELLTVNPITGASEPVFAIQGNGETAYDYSDPNSIVIQQTIGSDVYQQTITISGTIATEGAWIKL